MTGARMTAITATVLFGQMRSLGAALSGSFKIRIAGDAHALQMLISFRNGVRVVQIVGKQAGRGDSPVM